MTISKSEAIESFDTPVSKTASTSLKPRQSSKNIRISLLSQKQKERKQDGNSSSNARHRSDEVDDDDDEDDDDDDDDDNSTIQLAHTDTKSAFNHTTSSYSSLRSDLKQSGSLGQGSHSISRSGSSSTSIEKVADTDHAEAVVKEEIAKTNLISTPRSVSSTLLPPSSNREFTPTFRARSGTPATLGGVLRAETPGRRSLTETDFDTSTNMSDVEEDDQSQDVTYDYTHDEEPSEYIPPTTPKVGGFGVKPSKVKPHKEGMRSAATERAARDAEKGSTSADVKMLSSSESDTWGANFWCIIEQPNGQSFFANPETGECAWAVPAGTFVLPPRPQGQWWELFDKERELPYYFHTKTKETQWEKPKGFVIPLASIQESTMGKRFSRSELNGESLALSGDDKESKNANTRGKDEAESDHQSRQPPPPPDREPSIDEVRHYKAESKSKTQRRRRDPGPPPLAATSVEHRTRTTTGLSTIPSLNELSSSFRSEGKESRSSKTAHFLTSNPSQRSKSETWSAQRVDSFDSQESRKIYRRERDPAKRKLFSIYQDMSAKVHNIPTVSHGISFPTPSRPQMLRQNSTPIFVNRRRSVGFNVSTNILTADGTMAPPTLEVFATKHFVVHRVGFFRRKYPLHKLTTWQREPLRNALLPLTSNELRKDATRIFKIILRYFGDRENPVFWPRVPPSYYLGKSASSKASHCMDGHGIVSSGGGERPSEIALGATTSCANDALPKDVNGPTLLEEVKWLIERALVAPSLRDETFAQSMKQMSGHCKSESWNRGWRFLCILLSFFSPSKELAPYLFYFIQQSRGRGSLGNKEEIDQMAEFCISKLSRLGHHAGTHRSKGPTIADIQATENAAFNPQVFGQTLEVIMSRQAEVYPDVPVPIVLQFLTTALLSMNCFECSDIFRIPGDADLVYDLKRRIDEGKYSLKGIISPSLHLTTKANQFVSNEDVSVIASTFKLWLRELKDSIFPEHMYNDCLQACDDSKQIISLCLKLDTIHLRVVLYVVGFLQLFCSASVIGKTRMKIESLALVFAPNFLRSPSKDLEIVNNNLPFEQKFVETLLRDLPCSNLDPNFQPSFTADLAWGSAIAKEDPTSKGEGEQDGKGIHLSSSSSSPPSSPSSFHRLMGIGRDGINLTPRIRKLSKA